MRITALLIMIITILSKLLGFGREITLAYFYGASDISDAYLISITIPSVIFSFVATGLAVGYIPMYSKIMQNDGKFEANRFTNNLINILIVICTVIIIFGFLFTDQIVKIFASGFEGDTLALSTQFTKISLLAIYFTGVVSIFSGYLQLKGNYVIPALIGFPLNFLVIISIIFSSLTNILILSIGFVISIASQLLLLAPFLRRKGYRFNVIFDLKDKHIKKMAYIALPVILGVSVDQINILVDRTIASHIAVGGISALNYANRLNGFVQGIFVVSIVTVLYPMISKMVAENNMDGMKNSLSKSITGINLLVIPATTGAMMFAYPIVSFLFGRGAFDSQAVSMTSDALYFYSIGMIGFGLRDILSRAFYSMEDTRTPMVNAAIAMILNIILNLILSRYLGIGGLALATSISSILATSLLFISLRKKIGPFGMKSISKSFIKILFASLIMGIIAKFSFSILTNSFSQNISLITAIGISTLTYFVIIYFMKIEDVDFFIVTVKRKLKKMVGQKIK